MFIRSLCNVFKIFNKPLPNDKILDSTKMKAVADAKKKKTVIQIMLSVCDKAKNLVGGGENAAAFSPFPIIFSKLSFSGTIKKYT